MVTSANLRRMTEDMPLGASPRDVRRRIELIERLMERAVTVPVVGRKVGLDAIVGLVPVVGDVFGAMVGLYLVWEARLLGLPRWKLWRMLANVGVDTAVGAVPVAGDLFDFVFRSNSANLKILRKHLDKHHPETRVIEG